MKYLSVLCFPALPLVAQEKSVDPTASRELIRQWVQTERILSGEQTTWEIEKKRMRDLLDLYQKELKLLNEELNQAGAFAGLVDESKEFLGKELRQYREARQILRDTLVRLLPRIRGFVVRLPRPLRDEISSDINLLNAPSTLGHSRDILKSVIAVLTASGRFNRSITVVEDIREIPGRGRITVDVLYLGLCRAYYTTEAGDTAGIGIPGKDGWNWRAKPALADEIRRAIAIFQKDKQPRLIKLPVQMLGLDKK